MKYYVVLAALFAVGVGMYVDGQAKSDELKFVLSGDEIWTDAGVRSSVVRHGFGNDANRMPSMREANQQKATGAFLLSFAIFCGCGLFVSQKPSSKIRPSDE